MLHVEAFAFFFFAVVPAIPFSVFAKSFPLPVIILGMRAPFKV